jgi:hypothetical protein
LGATVLPAGGVALSTAEEIARFNAMAETSGAFLKLFHNMPPFVDRAFVDDFRSSFGLLRPAGWRPGGRCREPDAAYERRFLVPERGDTLPE